MRHMLPAKSKPPACTHLYLHAPSNNSYSLLLPSAFILAWYRSLISLLSIFPDGVLGIYTQ